MRITKWLGVGLVAGAMALAGGNAAAAFDQLKIIVPARPGGGFDQTGRNLGVAMQPRRARSRTLQYDNKGGAGGAIGLAQFVTTNKGDPNSLFVTGLVTVGATILNKSPVTLANVTPVARLTAESEAIIVPANSPLKTMKDLVAAMKANIGAVSFAGGSAGGTDHILAGLIAKDLGLDPGKVNYVPFTSGAEAVAAVLGGSVTAGISGYGEFAQRIKSGRVRALAVSGHERVHGADIGDAEGTGDQRRARQLARRLRRARHHAGPAEGADRGRRSRRPDREVAGHAEEARMDAVLPGRGCLQGIRRGRHQAHRGHPREPEPRQEISVRRRAWPQSHRADPADAAANIRGSPWLTHRIATGRSSSSRGC